VVQTVCVQALGPVASVVTALVGDDHPEAGRGKRLDLPAPPVPELGKAVQQDDQGAIFRSRLDGVQADAVRFQKYLFHRLFHPFALGDSLFDDPILIRNPALIEDFDTFLTSEAGFLSLN
jgi:hypothetical protein